MRLAAPPLQKCDITFLRKLGPKLGRARDAAHGVEQFLVSTVNEAAAAILDELRRGAKIPREDGRLSGDRFHADHAERLIGNRWDDAGQRVMVKRPQFQ